MIRTGIAFLAATVVLISAVSGFAAPVDTTVTVHPGWNLISVPAVPLNPAPADVFASAGGTPFIDGKLYRWDSVNGSMEQWDEFSSTFGNILLGDGYWLFKDSAGDANVTFSSVEVNGDHWISLPRTGWNLIGYPNSNPASATYESLKVTNGIETLDIAAAAAPAKAWVSASAYWWDNAAGSMKSVGIPDEFPDKESLEKNEGYWFYTNQDNLALIVPGL